jgi:hypothetical protein
MHIIEQIEGFICNNYLNLSNKMIFIALIFCSAVSKENAFIIDYSASLCSVVAF